jgi:hypothetical protein
MEMLVMQHCEWFFIIRHQMGKVNVARQAVSHPDCCDKIESEQGKVCEVVLCERFLLKMRMHKSQAPQSLSSQRIIIECRNKYPTGISHNHMGDSACPGDENTDLAVYLMGD